MNRYRMPISLLSGAVAAALSLNTFAATTSPGVSQNPADKSSTPPSTQSQPAKNDTWSDRLFDEFQDMQQRMEKIFHDATRDVNSPSMLNDNGFSSSFRMSESGNNYVVHVNLPDRDLSKVDARVENGRTLLITASEEKKAKTESAPNSKDKNASSTYVLGRYEQALTLPGDVDASKMHIDRSGSQLTITIPKAEASSSTTTPSGQQ